MTEQDSTTALQYRPVKALLLGALAGVLAWTWVRYVGVPLFMDSWVTDWQVIVLSAWYGVFHGWATGDPNEDVAVVVVDGEITRGATGIGSDATDAEEVVGAIEAADEHPLNYDGLVVDLNTPGGEPTPSEDIYHAIQEFDGPTAAVVLDQCASGGYMIAAACDHIVARESALVGSIGVIGSRVSAHGLAEDLGLEYEQFTAGEYKDAGHPLRETGEREEDYIQGLIEQYYDRFVQLVSGGRGLSEAEVRETEARVFLGDEAADRGLVDGLGDEDDAAEWVADQLGEDEREVTEGILVDRNETLLSDAGIAGRAAFCLGSGLASRIDVTDRLPIEVKRR